MPTATYNKFDAFMEQIAKATHNLQAPPTGHTLKVFLTNRQPLSTDTVKDATMIEIAAGSGYLTGGSSAQNSLSRTGPTTSILGVDIVWTAVGGNIGPFQHAVLYNSTAVGLNLVSWWSYPTSLTLFDGETFTLDFGTSLFTLA